jgi:uncharacterized protein YqgC (DUF456 family)
VNNPEQQQSPMAEALEWVSRILAVAAMMVLPGLAGDWADKRLGTGFLALGGFAVGVVCGIWYLLLLTKRPPKDGKSA